MFILATLAVIVVIGALFIGNIRQNTRDAIVLLNASAQSQYAVQEQLRNGYLSLPGGYRIGVCGSTVHFHHSYTCAPTPETARPDGD